MGRPPDRADERFSWLQARMAALEVPELREIVFDAWCMVVPRRLVAEQERLRS